MPRYVPLPSPWLIPAVPASFDASIWPLDTSDSTTAWRGDILLHDSVTFYCTTGVTSYCTMAWFSAAWQHDVLLYNGVMYRQHDFLLYDGLMYGWCDFQLHDSVTSYCTTVWCTDDVTFYCTMGVTSYCTMAWCTTEVSGVLLKNFGPKMCLQAAVRPTEFRSASVRLSIDVFEFVCMLRKQGACRLLWYMTALLFW